MDTSATNINPLTAEDLAKILDQSTVAAKLWSNPILVSVDELKNTVAKTQAVKVKTQEPPLTIQTIGILFLPPPPLPSVATDTLQMPSAAAGEVKKTSE